MNSLQVPTITFTAPRLNVANLAVSVALIAYLLMSLLWFSVAVEPALAGLKPVRFGADSATYIRIAETYRDESVFSDPTEFLGLVTVEGNFLGPVLLLKAVGFNLWLVIAFNCLMFLIALRALLASLQLDRAIFITLLLLNVMLLPSLLSLNKEIVGFTAVALFVREMSKQSANKFMLSLTLVLALAVRWQQAFVQLAFWLLYSRANPWRKEKARTMFLVILAITFLYPLFATHALNRNGSGLIAAPADVPTLGALSTLQDHYLFPLALPLKALANLTGPVPGIQYLRHRLSTLDYSDWFVMYVVPGHQLVTLLALLVFVIRGNYRPSRWTAGTYFGIFYVVVFSVSPFIQARYFFPIYGLICAAAAQEEPTNHSCESGQNPDLIAQLA